MFEIYVAQISFQWSNALYKILYRLKITNLKDTEKKNTKTPKNCLKKNIVKSRS